MSKAPPTPAFWVAKPPPLPPLSLPPPLPGPCRFCVREAAPGRSSTKLGVHGASRVGASRPLEGLPACCLPRQVGTRVLLEGGGLGPTLSMMERRP